MKIVLLVVCNDIGGAEFVTWQHVKMLTETKQDFTILSAEKGNFFNKMKECGADIIHIPQLNTPQATPYLEPYLKNCDIVFNCNFFAINKSVGELKKKYFFRYLAILHSDINFVFEYIVPFDNIIDGYYAIHEKIKNGLVSNGVDENKITIIPNTVDTDMISMKSAEVNLEIRKSLSISEDELILGMTTRIAWDKNIKDAFRILEKVNEKISASLVIIGEHTSVAGSLDYKKSLVDMINKSKFKNKVFILGKKTSEEVYYFQQCFDIAINTSPNEGLPISLLEQMAAGIYCIYPSVGDILQVLAGKGSIINVKKRLSFEELLKCYTEEEINDFVKTIIDVANEKIYRKGTKIRKFILETRSNDFVKEEFLKFINPIPTSKPVVSVVMPVYNPVIEQLKQAIASVMAQTFKAFELIIVDDGSATQGLGSYFETLEKEPNIDVILLPKNKGLATAMNKGIDASTTNLIARMDQDDIAHPDWLAKMVNYMYTNPEVNICGCQIKCFNKVNHITNHPSIIDKKYVLEKGFTWIVNHPGITYRKDFIQSLGGYDPEAVFPLEDWDLWCRILNSCNYIYNVPDVLIDYRVDRIKEQTPEMTAFREACRDSLKVLIKDKVTYHMATMPDRIEALKESVASILPQCDELHIYLNHFKIIPGFLKDPKIKTYLSDDHFGDIGDVGKFFNCENWSGYNFTVDDKIIYPGDYTEKTIQKIEHYNRKAIVTYHGRIIHENRPCISYYNDYKRGFGYTQNNSEDVNIDIPGTGVMAFHSDDIKFDIDIFTQTNMSDIFIGELAKLKNIIVVALQHSARWIKTSRHYDKSRSICATFANNDKTQTEIANSIFV